MFSYLAAGVPQNRSVAIVAGPTALLLADLPSEAPLAQLVALTRTVTFDSILDELRSQSEPAFKHFALLQTDVANERIRVAIGGQATAEFDDSGAFASPGQNATTELHMSQVAQVRLAIAPISSSVPFALPLADGVVQAVSLVWNRDDARTGPAEVPPPAISLPVAAPAPVQPQVMTAPDVAVPTPDLSAPAPAPAPAPAIPAPDAVVPTPNSPAPAPAPTEPQSTNIFDQLFGQTRFRDVEAAAVRDTGDAEAADQAQVQAQPQAQTSEISGSLSGTHLAQDASPFETALDQSGSPALALILPDGTVEPLDRAILVGRKPTVPRDESLLSFGLITLGHLNSGLSRTHLSIEPRQGGAAVTDLNSTNGTVLVRASGESIALLPHTSLLAHAGDQVVLGTTIVLSIAVQQ